MATQTSQTAENSANQKASVPLHVASNISQMTTAERRIYFDSVYRKRETAEIFGIAVSTLENWVRNKQFPKPLNLGGRCVGWLGSDILDHLNKLVAERDGVTQ